MILVLQMMQMRQFGRGDEKEPDFFRREKNNFFFFFFSK